MIHLRPMSIVDSHIPQVLTLNYNLPTSSPLPIPSCLRFCSSLSGSVYLSVSLRFSLLILVLLEIKSMYYAYEACTLSLSYISGPLVSLDLRDLCIK